MTTGAQHCRGFTYVEVLLAAVLLAGMATTMGYAMAHVRDVDQQQAYVDQGRYLLQDGIAWLRSLARVDPTVPSGWGKEAGETTVADFDDVDDLDGLVETAPIDRTGAKASADWQRTWTVRSADLTTPTADATNGSTALLRVHVAVLRLGSEVTSEILLLSRTP